MKLLGTATRIELKPETDEEKAVCRRIINGEALIYWGDAECEGGALIINSAITKNHRKKNGKRKQPPA